MNKNIGDMTRSELIDYVIELQEENSGYERKIDKAIELLEKENERLEKNNQAMQEEMARTWEKLDKTNNIINELEKWAKEELEHPNWASCGARCMLDKLQSLKGDSSNE